MNATAEQKTPSNSFDPAQYATRVPRDVDAPQPPAPGETTRAFRPPATSITDTTLDTKIETATDDSSQPIEPETVEEAEPDKRWAILTAVGRVAAAAGAAAFVALLFVIVIPSLRQQSAESSSAAAIDSLKAAMSRAEQTKLQDAKPSPELQSILASSESSPPVSHQESEELLKQFMQWQQKPADGQEK